MNTKDTEDVRINNKQLLTRSHDHVSTRSHSMPIPFATRPRLSMPITMVQIRRIQLTRINDKMQFSLSIYLCGDLFLYQTNHSMCSLYRHMCMKIWSQTLPILVADLQFGHSVRPPCHSVMLGGWYCRKLANENLLYMLRLKQLSRLEARC